jgi:3-hydroxybutyryl-CoA dehydrogenase
MTVLRVAVIGAGTMGHGIAQVAAMAGHSVTLADAAPGIARKGHALIRANLDGGIARSKVTLEQRDNALARIRVADDVRDGVQSADLIVEAVPERTDLKIAVFQQLERDAPTGSIFASNTSSLSITEMQSVLRDPGRMIGLHFFNPVHINSLVEIVHGRNTSEQTVKTALEFVRGLGKDPILVKDSPGFATSRLGVLIGLEAIRMLEEGVASAEDIDKAMVLGYRHPMGPLRLTDLVGLDVRLAIANHLHEALGRESFRAPDLLVAMVADGRLGRKSGEGFYTWNDKGMA